MHCFCRTHTKYASTGDISKLCNTKIQIRATDLDATRMFPLLHKEHWQVKSAAVGRPKGHQAFTHQGSRNFFAQTGTKCNIAHKGAEYVS